MSYSSRCFLIRMFVGLIDRSDGLAISSPKNFSSSSSSSSSTSVDQS